MVLVIKPERSCSLVVSRAVLCHSLFYTVTVLIHIGVASETVNTVKTKELSHNQIQYVQTSACLGHVTYLFECYDFGHFLLNCVPKTVGVLLNISVL